MPGGAVQTKRQRRGQGKQFSRPSKKGGQLPIKKPARREEKVSINKKEGGKERKKARMGGEREAIAPPDCKGQGRAVSPTHHLNGEKCEKTLLKTG